VDDSGNVAFWNLAVIRDEKTQNAFSGSFVPSSKDSSVIGKDAQWGAEPVNGGDLPNIGQVLIFDASVMHAEDQLIYPIIAAQFISLKNINGDILILAGVDEIASSINLFGVS
jgi:hypothetical protein